MKRKLCAALLSSVLASRLLAQEASNQLGSVEGVVTFRGEIPKAANADDTGVHRALLEVDRETRGLRYVVAWLLLADGTSNYAPAPTIEKPRITVDQQDYAFVPRVIAVREGEPVSFTNSDPANHNVRTASGVAKNEFNVFTGAGGNYEHRFAVTPRRHPIQLTCDIHPWMRGWVYVFVHNHFAVTDKRGSFRIPSVAPGNYKLLLEQPDISYTHEQTITVTKDQPTKLELEAQVSSSKAKDQNNTGR
jgi:plastocyanin